MLENENLVTEEVTENVEQTTEETQAVETPTEKTYTQSELDEIIGKRLARNTAKIHKEYERKIGQYSELETVLKAGTGKSDVKEMTDTFRDFYQKKGINIPKQAEYSARDIEVLARAEADDFIRAGIDEVVEEVDRLAELGAENMTAREKAVYKILLEHGKNAEKIRELEKNGVSEEVYNSDAFKNFAAQFNPNTPIADIYNIYKQTQPKHEVKTMGSMKQSQASEQKDYYSPEDIDRLTEEDLDKPGVWEAVRRSMTGK